MSDTHRSRIFRYWPTSLVMAISFLAGWIVWQRPIPPTWDLESDLCVRCIGISGDGRLVTTEQELDSGKPVRLRIRDIRSGHIQRDFDLESSASPQYMLLTPDGKYAVVVDSRITLEVVSLEDGHLRFPTSYARRVDEISPDSQYALIDLDGGEVIDLENGETLSKFEGDADFSEDGQRILITRSTDGVIDVWIRDLKTGSEAHLGQVPKIPDPKLDMIIRRVRSLYWRNDRLYVSYELKTDDEIGFRYQHWSYDTRGKRLTDPRFEPHLFTKKEALRVTLCSTIRDGNRGELRLHFRPPAGSFMDSVLDGFDWLGIPTGPKETEDSWQPIDSSTELPVGSRIEGLTLQFVISPDGQWIVDHCQQRTKNGLRAWRLPARRGLFRWLQSGAAALVPFLLVGLYRLFSQLRKRRVSRQTPGFPVS